jgi:hypothetical protein
LKSFLGYTSEYIVVIEYCVQNSFSVSKSVLLNLSKKLPVKI